MPAFSGRKYILLNTPEMISVELSTYSAGFMRDLSALLGNKLCSCSAGLLHSCNLIPAVSMWACWYSAKFTVKQLKTG